MAGPFFLVNVRAHWADTDAAGVVWFGNFFRYFEEAEDQLFRVLGRTRVELMGDFGVMMPRIEATCRYRSPARAEDLLAVGIQVSSVGARRIGYAFEIRETASRRLVAEGAYQVACVTRDRFEPVEFPRPILDLLARFAEVVEAQGEFRRQRGAGWA